MCRRDLLGILVLIVCTGTVESTGICDNPMLSTNRNNATITVSSLLLDPNVVATPDRAILDTKELDLGQGHYDAGGWVSGIQDTNQYLQVQLTRPSVITGLVTQGRNGCCKQWVTEYNVSYSQDCKTWIKVDKTFSGNADQDTGVTNLLPCPISAKCIRFIPLKWNDKISMRVDVLGCPILPISTVPFTTMPFSSSTLTSPTSSPLSNISSTTAMTQTTNGLTTTTYTSSAARTSLFVTASSSTGSTNTQTCTDASGIDCQLLDSQVNICANILASSKYCAKYCGICGPTTSSSLSLTMTDSTISKSSLPSSPPTSLMSSTVPSQKTTSIASTTRAPSSSVQAVTGATQTSLTPPKTSKPSKTVIYQTPSSSVPSTTVSTCKDNPSINCSILNSTVALCGNFLTAQMYCPKFCNVCGIINSTFAVSSSTIKLQTQSSTTSMPHSSATTGSVCQDKSGVDCALLQKFLYVCQNPNTANLYCSRYCGVCLNVTTAPQLNTRGNSPYSTVPSIISLSTLQNNTNPPPSITGGQLSSVSVSLNQTANIMSSFAASPKTTVTTTFPKASASTFSMLTTASCSDKPGIDCKMLDNYLGICNDRTSASMYCPLFCGVCGQTARLSQNPSSASQSGTAPSSTRRTMTVGTTSMTSSQASTFTFSTSSAYVTTTTTGSASNGTMMSTTIPSSTVALSRVCSDKKGIDCHQLDIYLNVCRDQKTAQLYCPKYCGICGTTLSAQSQSTLRSSTMSVPNVSNLSTANKISTTSSQTVPATNFVQPSTSSPLPTQAFSSAMTTTGSISQRSSTLSAPNKTLANSSPFSSNTAFSSTSVSISSPATTQQSPPTTSLSASNSLLVSTTSANTCSDKQGVDCHLLDSSLNICKDPVTSMAYCRKYCGLCGSFTTYSLSQSSTAYNYLKSSTTSKSGTGMLFPTTPTTQSPVITSTSQTISLVPLSKSSSTPNSSTFSIGNGNKTIPTISGIQSGQSSAVLSVSTTTANPSAQSTVFLIQSTSTPSSSSIASVPSNQQYSTSGSPAATSTTSAGQSSSTSVSLIFNATMQHSLSSSVVQTTGGSLTSGNVSWQKFSTSGQTSIQTRQPTTTLKSVTQQSSTFSKTHDPCNDTLDCQLLDKFWGVCRNITIASGCLTYCGFCPSGVPLSLGSTLSHISTVSTGSQISKSSTKMQQSTAINQTGATSTPSSSKVSTVSVFQTTSLVSPSSSSSSGIKTSYSPSSKRNTMSSQRSSSKISFSSTQSGSTTTGTTNPVKSSSGTNSNSISSTLASTTNGTTMSLNSAASSTSAYLSQSSSTNTNSFSHISSLKTNGTTSQTIASSRYTPVSSRVHNTQSSSLAASTSNGQTKATVSFSNTFSVISASPGLTGSSLLSSLAPKSQSSNSGSTNGVMTATSLSSITPSAISGNPVTSVGSSVSTSSVLPSSSPSTTISPISTTTYDPCNDTLDCALLDKFWGICRNITIASGCLTYCGFCPSGVPLQQGTSSSNTVISRSTSGKYSSSSTLSTIPQSSAKQVSHMRATGSTSSTGTVNFSVSPLASSPSSSNVYMSTSPMISASSQSGLMKVTLTNAMTGSTKPSCQDKPSVDCNVLNKFWNICADIKTAQPCLRSCGFCP